MKNLVMPEFRLSLGVFALLLIGFIPGCSWSWLFGIGLGIFRILQDSLAKIRRSAYSLDYIAFLAMMVALPSHEWLAGAVVALMITGGEALDKYASGRAESALRSLLEKIPKICIVKQQSGDTKEVLIQAVRSGETILVRPNELIPLDGTLVSDSAAINEANLTGEALPVVFEKNAFLKSGAINAGPTIEMTVEGDFGSSTYMKIVHLVDEAKSHPPQVVRLAEKFNFPFTAITLLLAGAAWVFTADIARALAVLVIATPCPLLIAAPVAFIGGLSRAARSNIIVKRPATLESISAAKAVFFDKTGTLTLGEPHLNTIVSLGDENEQQLLAIAAAIEFHSIHPLARAIQNASNARHIAPVVATGVQETIGKGIEGVVGGVAYRIGTSAHEAGWGITLSIFRDEKEIGRLHFEDAIKEDVGEMFRSVAAKGLEITMLTGDRAANAQRLFGSFGISIRADQTPESKFSAIDEGRKKGPVIMVGDGLNDAPALAQADVGIVFSGTENSAAIDAADAVILSRDVMLVPRLLDTATRSKHIALQSIWVGIGLSCIGMLFASFGFIPPVVGAILQECIDVAAILNSLRAALE